ncbi:indolethylamine N-methyltransferase-like [Branchiostoma floridae x Branchiostoma belcheri]
MSAEQEEYEYFKNAREYLEYFYSDLTGAKCPDEGEWMPWSMEQFHRTFSEDRGFGGRLLDIGSGPTVYQLVSASRVFPEIVCSDFHRVSAPYSVGMYKLQMTSAPLSTLDIQMHTRVTMNVCYSLYK